MGPSKALRALSAPTTLTLGIKPKKETNTLARKKGIKLALDMAYMSLMSGEVKDILPGNDKDYVTIIDFILDIPADNIKQGIHKVEYKNTELEILIKVINNPEEDPIMQFGSSGKFGVSGTGVPDLPFSAFTDNRGEYPCVLVRIVFPYRLADWIDPNHPSGIKMDHDPDEIAISGLPQNKEKIEALKAINKLIKSDNVRKGNKLLSYEEITVFIEVYFKKNSKTPSLSKLTALASNTAYKDAVEDYFLDGFDQQEIKSSINNFLTLSALSYEKIIDEECLLNAVLTAINHVLVHHIENRRWIDAFWDGARTIKHEDQEIKVPRKPKNETRIQPTLHVVLDMALSPLGIQVIRESDEGAGSLDFRCLLTTQKGIPLSVGLEFKLAHHKEVKKGINNQLPAYLKAIKSNSGIFSVMWFKDGEGKIFNEPKRYEKEGFVSWLDEEAKNVSNVTGHKIVASVIDASIKVSASNI